MKTKDLAKLDQDVLRYAGMMGHTFCVVYSGPDGDRRRAGECCDVETARKWKAERAGHAPAIYRKAGKRWVLTA